MNNKDDLISRSKLISLLETPGTIYITGMRAGKTWLVDYTNKLKEAHLEAVRSMPAVDIRERHYGLWEDIGRTKAGTTIRRCSYCKVTKAGRPRSNFCPDCGCKMLNSR